MLYNLRIWALGHGTGIELAESDYDAIVAAMQHIYLARGIEEKLDLLLENFMEYERDLLALGLKHSLFPPLDDHRVAVERQLVNRRVINLLSSARMYIDQIKHSISQLCSPASGSAPAALFKVQYDQYLEYRVAEALRNFSQHQALPVHIMSWPSAWEEMESESKRLRFGIVPSISIDELLAEGGFKASVLAELQSSGKKQFSLTLIVRQYVESLAVVHEQVRMSIAGQIEQDHEVVLKALERAQSEFGERLVGLVVSKGVDPLQVDEHHFVNEKSWARREFLIKKNSSYSKLSRRYVSAEHPGDVA